MDLTAAYFRRNTIRTTSIDLMQALHLAATAEITPSNFLGAHKLQNP
jgi:hypothetical protein